MKSKFLDRLTILSSAGILLMIVFLYLLMPEFAISFSRSLEMIKSGSDKGLMMIYYQFKGFALLFAALTYAVQLIAMVFHNSAVHTACYGLFQPFSAKLALTLGGLMALLWTYSFSSMLSLLLRCVKPLSAKLDNLQAFHQKYDYFWVGLIAVTMTAQPGPQYALLYFVGFLCIDLRKLLPAATLMMLIFL